MYKILRHYRKIYISGIALTTTYLTAINIRDGYNVLKRYNKQYEFITKKDCIMTSCYAGLFFGFIWPYTVWEILRSKIKKTTPIFYLFRN